MAARDRARVVGGAALVILVGLGAALFVTGDRRYALGAAECRAFVDRHAELYGREVGPEYARLLDVRREGLTLGCRRFVTPSLVECSSTAADVAALERCMEPGLRPVPSREAATDEQCTDQTDWRIALHRQLELPSIADGIAETRANMIGTCTRHFSEPYAACLAGAPSLAFANACETVGRTPR